MEDLKKKTASGLFYKFLERGFVKGAGFIISIVLARILMPEEYGVVALVTIFIAFCDAFVTSGFASSLVVNKDSDDEDFSTCFHFNLILSVVLYVAVFFTAPLIASFYENDLLVWVIRIMAIRIPLASINSIEQAWIQKEMKFKLFFWATLVGTIVSGAVAIVMAYNGFGVWSLVEQTLGNMVLDTLILWALIKWKPRFIFNVQKFKKQFGFGWKVLVVGLIDVTYSQLRGLAIGKKYSSEDLGYYNRGTQFSELGMTVVEPTISGVLFPALSKCNDDKELMKKATKRSLKLSSFIIFPCILGIAACGSNLITVLLTEKWDPCWIYLEIGCLAYLFRPMQVINNSLIKASKNSTLLLVLDIIKKTIGIVSLVICLQFGVVAIAISFAATNLVSTIINIFPNKKIINYGYLEQIADISKYLAISVAMGVIVYAITFIQIQPVWQLLIQITVGVVFYFGVCTLIKDESLLYCYHLITGFLKPKKGNL